MRMVDDHQHSADAFHKGTHSFHHFAMGFALTRGWTMPWRPGCFILQRRRLYPDVGEWTFVGSADVDAATIKNYPGFPHEPDMAFQYAAAVAFGNGQASEFCEPIRLDFDDDGELISPPMPMFPVNLFAVPIAGGKFLVSWDYDPHGHGAWPKDFQVFGGADAGSIDYGTPLVDSMTGLSFVSVVGAQRRFEFTTAGFSNGTTKVFGVRARNSAGRAELNTRTSSPAIAIASVAASAESISQAVQGRQR